MSGSQPSNNNNSQPRRLQLESAEAITGMFILVGIPILATINWALSLVFAKIGVLDWKGDARQLWTDSKAFLRMQAIFILLIIAGNAYDIASPFINMASGSGISWWALAAKFAEGILFILELFYLSYLGSTKGVMLIGTIGIWTVFTLGIAEKVLEAVTAAGFAALLIPGLIITVRTSLFLPVFAVEGHRIIYSIQRSWSLTKSKYWITSRYLGPTALASALLTSIAGFVLAANAQEWRSFAPITIVFAATYGVLTVGFQLMYQGLSYKLYLHLTEGERVAVEAAEGSSA